MEYRNKKTGAVIRSESKLGGNWEPVAAPAVPSEKKAAPTKKKGTGKK